MLNSRMLVLALVASCLVCAQKAAPDVIIAAHQSAIPAIAYSPDGKLLATAGEDGFVKVWDLATKKALFSAEDMKQSGNQLRFTADGKSLVAIHSSQAVVVLSVPDGKVLRKFTVSDMVGGPQCIDLSPDGKTLAIGGRAKVVLVNFEDGKVGAEVNPPKGGQVNGVSFSADGKSLVMTGNDKMATVMTVADGKVVKAWPTEGNGLAAVFAPDGKSVFVACDDRVLRVGELAADEPKRIIEKGVPLMTLELSRDGKAVIVGGPGHAPWIIAVADRQLVEPPIDSEEWVKSAAMSPDGVWLAGGGHGGSLFLWKSAK